MSEFKFICPVCGQHIKCDSSLSGKLMECPTCYQKIIAPQAPENPNSTVVLRGFKVSARPAVSVTAIDESASAGEAVKGASNLVVIAVIAVVVGIMAVAAVFIFRGSSIKLAATAAAAASARPGGSADQGNDGLWMLNLASVPIPNVPAVGRVHGVPFVVETMIFKPDHLTLCTADTQTAGVTLYLSPAQSAGRTFAISPGDPASVGIAMRYRSAAGQTVWGNIANKGYALRLEFGPIINNQVAGKIYLCFGDAEKSYVVGSFNAKLTGP